MRLGLPFSNASWASRHFPRLKRLVAWVLAAGLAQRAAAQPSELRLGIFMPWEGSVPLGPYVAPAVLRAVAAINSRTDILGSTELKWVWHDTQCNPPFAIEAMMDMKLKYDVDAFIGPPCSTSALASVPTGAYWKIPFISWLAGSPTLSDKAAYPYFARVNGHSGSSLVLCIELARHIGWDRLGVVVADNDLATSTAYDLLARLNADIAVSLGYSRIFANTEATNANHTMSWMPRLKDSGTRIVVIIGDCLDTRSVLLAASRLGMLLGYQYLLISASSICHMVAGTGFPPGWGPEANAEAAAAFDNTLSMRSIVRQTTPETLAFEAGVKVDFQRGAFDGYRFPPAGTITPTTNVTVNRYKLEYSNRSSTTMPAAYLGYAAHLYDAIELYARAADRLIRTGSDPSQDPGKVAEVLSNTTFSGMTGFVTLDANLDRNPSVLLEQVRRKSDSVLEVARIGVYDVKTQAYLTDASASIMYPGDTPIAPPAFVLRDCTVSDFDEVVAAKCNADLVRVVQYERKEGVSCAGSLPADHLDCLYLPAASGMGKIVIVVAGFAALLAAACAAWVICYRREKIVVFAQPVFCLLYLLGCVALNVSSLLRIGRDDVLFCVASPVMFHISFTLCFSALLAKIYRVWRLFMNDKLTKRSVHAHDVIQLCVFFLAVDASILATMGHLGLLGPKVEAESQPESSHATEGHACQHGGVYVYALWGVKGLVMLVTCGLAWQVRNVNEVFAESKHMMIAAYQATTLCIIAALVVAASAAIPVQVLVQAFAAATATTGGTAAIFGPKIMAVHRGQEADQGGGNGSQTHGGRLQSWAARQPSHNAIGHGGPKPGFRSSVVRAQSDVTGMRPHQTIKVAPSPSNKIATSDKPTIQRQSN